MARITPLKRALFESGRRQVDLAREIDMDAGHLSRIVNGLHPTDDTKRRIANALDLQVHQLWPDNEAAA